MKKYEPMIGTHVTEAAKGMAALAVRTGDNIESMFNDIALTTTPGEDPAMIVERYQAASDLRAEEYRNSPEGIASAKAAEEFQAKAAASAAEGIKPFQIARPDDWAKDVAANTDGYGACGIRYAARWANLMEQGIAYDRNYKAGCLLVNEWPTCACRFCTNPTEFILDWLRKNADRCSFEADTEGITGFMHGCAVSVLARVWVHGELLRRWHNKATQLGTEGDLAKDSGGVLNPSMIKIGAP